MSLTHPALFILSLLLTGLIVLRARRSRASSRAILFSALCFSIAAGGLTFTRHPSQPVTVMLDLSPSTRGGLYRSRSALRHRTAELLGSTSTRWLCFSDHVEPLNIDAAEDAIADIPSDQTVFMPPTDDPVLLFSDGRFDPSARSPRIYPVIDPLLSDTHDAAVTNLSARNQSVSATLKSTEDNSVLQWTGVQGPAEISLKSGSTIADSTLRSDSDLGDIVTARVVSHDLWPENDSLSIVTDRPGNLQRCWVGDNGPPDWIAIQPGNFPCSVQALLNTSNIVLNNIAADALSQEQQATLQRYVQNLGGGLLIIGGDRAFARGDYVGTTLQAISPLSGYPPNPSTQWSILLDASGSMADGSGGTTRMQRAIDAAAQLIPELPPNDRVSIGEFAATLTWLLQSGTPAEAAESLRHRNGKAPNGPTNLRAALASIAKAPSSLPTRLLILTDGDAPIEAAPQMISQLNAAHLRVDVLLLSTATASDDFTNIVHSTGGRILAVEEMQNWADALRVLATPAVSDSFVHTRAAVHYQPTAGLPDRNVDAFNPTWLVDRAISLTTGDGPRVAIWQSGAGAVGAIAFKPNPLELSHLEKLLSTLPTSNELEIDWPDAPDNLIHIRAERSGEFENHLRLTIAVDGKLPDPIALTSPGHYESPVPFSTHPAVALIRNDDKIIARHWLAGRYPREFDSIGNDLPALQKLAAESGGEVIAPNVHTPIDFHWAATISLLHQWFAACGMIVLAAACWFRRSSM